MLDVTNAANLKYFNFSNIGSLEQDSGQEKGLTVILYEYFYDC